MDSEEAKQALALYGQLESAVSAFKSQKWSAWCELVASTSEGQLKKPLVM